MCVVVFALVLRVPLQVVFRHSDGPADIAGLDADALTGYGMELAIKSSEYKTHVDEEKVEEERESEVANLRGLDEERNMPRNSCLRDTSIS